jgi:proline iminopeptidase
MLNYFPPLKPYADHMIDVGHGHALRVYESGSPVGLPVLLIHNGPGLSQSTQHRRIFDPTRYRIIQYDQRGCGESTPHGELNNNTTRNLLDDIEVIRNALAVRRWVVAGGGWGATLALMYAEEMPKNVQSLLLWSVFLSRQQDLDWMFQNGASHVFPEEWQHFCDALGVKTGSGDLIQLLTERLNGHDELARMAVAKAWACWYATCACFHPSMDILGEFKEPHLAMNMALISSHYLQNKGFMEENQIILRAKPLADIPGCIIHGRFDMVCPLDNAWALHEAWPASELFIVRDAGHSDHEAGLVDLLVRCAKTLLAPGE